MASRRSCWPPGRRAAPGEGRGPRPKGVPSLRDSAMANPLARHPVLVSGSNAEVFGDRGVHPLKHVPASGLGVCGRFDVYGAVAMYFARRSPHPLRKLRFKFGLANLRYMH